MNTTDPIYYKPLLPHIRISNTANNTIIYEYSSFSGLATGATTTVFPLYCSVSLSQNTHGTFTVQFEDSGRQMEAAGITVGSRVLIRAAKQSTALVRLISGLVRKKGYSRGSNGKILYSISGSSTGIRLNELITYAVNQGRKTGDGITFDETDPSRKADTLLASSLNYLTADGVLSIANLAANSDVETFIASLSIEYGEYQDLVNYIEEQSGGEVVVDTTDLVNFRYEIKNNLFGRGFTLKNDNANKANDDADDTMYLEGKNWTCEDGFYKSDNFSNHVYAVMRGQPRPGQPADLGFTDILNVVGTVTTGREFAFKFRPTHTRCSPGDFYIVGAYWVNSTVEIEQFVNEKLLLICKDAGGVPQDAGGVVGIVYYFQSNFSDDPTNATPALEDYVLVNDSYHYNLATNAPGDFYLDTTKDYWAIFSNINMGGVNHRFAIGGNALLPASSNVLTHTSNFANIFNGGSGWTSAGTVVPPAFGAANYRSMSFNMWDPKSWQNIASGLTAGMPIDAMVPEAAVQIDTKESMYRHLAGQLSIMAKPRTTYNFPRCLCPNIPPLPGDPIIIDDTILGFSRPGNQVLVTTCGDMTYSWGSMDRGQYEAPTRLGIQALAVHSKYR